uniref:Transaldolase n=1 Tax=Panagrellus redivivus TaxID=6233 RepID=A0A7E4WCI8_PANRE
MSNCVQKSTLPHQSRLRFPSKSFPLSVYNMSVLEQLKKHSTVVADTGEFNLLKKYLPDDATTNPSLILAAAKNDDYKPLITQAIAYAKSKAAGKSKAEIRELAVDKLFVLFGKGILSIIPGRVSTEIDARLSYSKEGSVAKGVRILKLYEEEGIDKKRVLVKLASTWEGIQAARELETKYGIHTNLTLLFGFHQAVACAQANVTLISPFVGRVMDWYQKRTGVNYTRDDDPGVLSVKRIYNYYKKFGYKTEIMAASFRGSEEIKGLVGVDLLTIRPRLLDELAAETETITPKLTLEAAKASDAEEVEVTEEVYRFQLNQDAMATEKLAEGIRRFVEAAEELDQLVDALL